MKRDLPAVHIEDCRDVKLIDSIIAHPAIYPHVADDSAPPAEKFTSAKVVGAPGIHFLAPIVDGAPMGVFMLARQNGIMYEIHTCILPAYWGRQALDGAAAMVLWMFTNTSCRKLMTWVPVYNRLAYKFALRAGMVDEGLSKRSFLRNGVLFDQHLLGMERGTSCR